MNKYYYHAEEMETWMVGNLFKDLDTICITSILVYSKPTIYSKNNTR